MAELGAGDDTLVGPDFIPGGHPVTLIFLQRHNSSWFTDGPMKTPGNNLLRSTSHGGKGPVQHFPSSHMLSTRPQVAPAAHSAKRGSKDT